MNFRLSAIGLLAASLALLAAAGAAEAKAPEARGSRPFGTAKPASVRTIDIGRRIDVNSINMFVANNGSFAYNLGAGDSGLFYPKGTDKSAVYASGLWLGARIVDGDQAPDTTLGTVVAEYSMEYGPGGITSLPGNPPVWDSTSDPLNVVYKVVRFTGARDEDGNLVDTMHVERVANDAAFEDDLVHHSWSEYMAGAARRGAPWKLYRLPDTSTPAEGDSVDVPGPDVKGDMMLWAVYNDADPDNHTNDAGGSEPFGIEIQQTTFAFNRQGALGNTVFMSYKIINKGYKTLTDMYISQWADPDLGGSAGYTDDLVGCDTLPDGTGKPRSLGFVYNSTNNDGGYGAAPPALGYDFFRGPNVAADGDPPLYLGMTSFNKYINGTDPATTDETYAYMQGLDLHGDPVTDPWGNVTTYNVAGDPVSPGPNDWLDAVPADRRFMLSSGPFTMHPGDEQVVTCAIIVGQGKNRLSSISALRFNDEFAQDAFDKDFDLPSPPIQPKVIASTDHAEIVLSWDAQSRTNYTEEGYAFEGYNVYQGATVAGPWTLIATYDEVNGTRVIYDRVFDVESGQLIPEYPVAFGSDAGVRFSHTITQDAVKGGPIYDGTEYYFAVTAYGYNPDGLPKVLENAQNVVRVTPQRPASGTDLATASATPVTYLRKDTAKAPATDVVSVQVVNPEEVTGHTYKVVFEELTPPFFGNIGSLTDVTAYYSWSLVDSTTGEVKFSGQLNRNGDEDYRVVDGIKVTVFGKYEPLFQDAVYLNNNTAHRRALQGVNWGGPAFGGGASSGYDFFGSTINPATDPDSFTTVELRFSTTETQMAHRIFRLQQADGTAPIIGTDPYRGYYYGGFHPVNMQAWDIVNNIQLDLVFMEKMVTAADGTYLDMASQPASQDSTWNPSEAGDGDREYLWVMKYPYTGAPKAPLTVNSAMDGENVPVMWAMWVNKRAASDVIDDGDAFQFIWANPAKDNDVYVFNTSALVRSDASVAKANLNRIRAVPNPYYAHSTYELNQINRKLRFVNMPEACTVRIFNLAGQLVRTLQKTDATTSILEWDLETANALPVGSGVYIFHVDVPGVGAYTGRLVVFMEKERLNSF